MFVFRPVMAILDLEVLEVEEARRQHVLKDVIEKEGPPDATVVVAMANSAEFDDDTINPILGVLGEVGDIVLVR